VSAVWRLRAAVLVLAGVLVVHHGRYALAPREHSHALAAVHAYLAWLVPITGALVFVAVMHFAARACGPKAGTAPRLPRTRTLWVSATACLLSVYGVQEAVEGLFAHGELPGLGALLGNGGFVAIPLAVGVGGILSLLLSGAATVVRWALARRRPRVRRRVVAASLPSSTPQRPRASVLARRLAGRGPPAVA